MKTKRSAFNLVEITLAIAVVGIGIASVMALFIPAIDSTKNSIADNYTADVANTFTAHVRSVLKTVDWTNLNNAFSTYTNAITSESSEAVLLGDNNPASWDLSSTLKVMPGIYRYSNSNKSLYRIKVGNEFNGHIRIGYEEINKDSTSDDPNVFYTTEKTGTNIHQIPPTDMIRIYFELSWPVTKPYHAREKRLYVTDVYNTNQMPER